MPGRCRRSRAGSISTAGSGTRASTGWTSTSTNFKGRRNTLTAKNPDMVADAPKRTLTVTLPSDREIAMRRVFDAPRALVFEACTRPEHVARWWGPLGSSLTVVEMDVRPGGAWRFVLRGPDGQ